MSPVLSAALALASGIAIGLARQALLPPVVAAALLLLFLHVFRDRETNPAPRRNSPSSLPPIALLAWIVCAGGLLGARQASLFRQSCENSIDSGERVRVLGSVAEDLAVPSGGSDGKRRRLSLSGVRLFADAGECSLPRLTVFSGPAGAVSRAGDPLFLEGNWLRLRPDSAGGGGIQKPGRVGILVRAVPLEQRSAGSSLQTGPGSGVRSLRRAMRSALSRRLRASLPPDVDPTARALLLAERDELAPELRRKFADAGLAHLLAISGLHVGIVFGLALAILSPLAGGRHRYLAAAAAVGLYVTVLGAPIPALRASLLCVGWAVARFRGTPIRGSDLLGAAALLFLIAEPGSVATPGFQLSFAGYAGVSLGLRLSREAMPDLEWETRPTGRSIRASGRLLIPLLAAGAGAFLATAPIAALHFGQIAPISILSNLVGTPIVALSIWSLVGAILPDPLGGSFAAVAVVLLRVLHSTADWFGSGAVSHFDAAPPLPDTWLAWAVGFASLSWLARGAAVVKVMIPLASAVALVIAQPIQQLRDSRRPGMICTLSVGQGDAAILRTHRGRWIVFDAGPSARPGPGREEIRTALRRRGARGVALVTISHPDLDHIGGMEGLMHDLPVGGVLDTGDALPRDAYARLLDLSGELGIPWIRARAGLRIQVDEVEVLVLGPDSSSAGDQAGPPSANETSLIVRVTAGGFRYLNSGDARMEEERSTLAAWPAESLRADLLKIGHHGSRTSSSESWIAAIRPSLAVISAGAGNRFGHPHAEVLNRIDAVGVPGVWRTDRNGTLCIDYRRDGSWRITGETGWNAALASKAGRWHED